MLKFTEYISLQEKTLVKDKKLQAIHDKILAKLKTVFDTVKAHVSRAESDAKRILINVEADISSGGMDAAQKQDELDMTLRSGIADLFCDKYELEELTFHSIRAVDVTASKADAHTATDNFHVRMHVILKPKD